jgi:hypothetical protein
MLQGQVFGRFHWCPVKQQVTVLDFFLQFKMNVKLYVFIVLAAQIHLSVALNIFQSEKEGGSLEQNNKCPRKIMTKEHHLFLFG